MLITPVVSSRWLTPSSSSPLMFRGVLGRLFSLLPLLLMMLLLLLTSNVGKDPFDLLLVLFLLLLLFAFLGVVALALAA